MISLADIQGHWVRHWIKAPGFEDGTTRVHWMQAGEVYADVRIPRDRPDLGGADCLAQLPAQSLHALASAEGFAGTVTLQDNRCTWQRGINWHGTPDAPDVGAISFDAQGRMIETGVLADYTELWQQKATADTSAIRFTGQGYAGVLVRSGDVAVLGIGQPAKASTRAAVTALSNGQTPDDAAKAFDGLHALCDLRDGQMIATLATDPFVEGEVVITIEDRSVTWHRRAFDGAHVSVEMARVA